VVLRGIDPAAVAAISAIVSEEQQHHDHSVSCVQEGTFWPKVVAPIVSTSTEAVIWLGMRL
jgi:ubiquinone biosynthesis monooxygenase Coq7